MNWYLKHIFAINQQILNLLKQKQVSQEVIQFIQSLPDNQAGKYISTLMRNPSLSLQDLQNIGKPKQDEQLISVARVLGRDPDVLNYYINQADPTVHGEYRTWLLKQVKQKNLRLPEDSHRIYESLSKFHRFKNNPNNNFEKNIHQYTDLHEVEELVDNLKDQKSKNKGQLQVDPLSLPGVTLEKESKNYVIYRISDANSLEEIGENTKWCTRKSYPNPQAKNYLKRYKNIYVVATKSRELLYQYTPDFDQFMDINDKEVKGIEEEIYKLLRPDPEKASPETLYSYIYSLWKKRDPESEPYIMKSPRIASLYAENFINGPWKEAEPYIAKEAGSSYNYAVWALRGKRFPLGEDAIKSNPRFSYMYARDAVKGEWKEAEPYIAKDAGSSYLYASEVIKKRFLLAEPLIKNDMEFNYLYARSVLNSKWPGSQPSMYEQNKAYYSTLKDFEEVHGKDLNELV